MTRKSAFFLLINLLFGCTASISEDNQPFQYDPAYLGEYVSDSVLNVTFAPPIKWKASTLKDFSIYSRRLNQTYPNQVSVRHLFTSPGNTNSFLTLSAITGWPEQGLDAMKEFYRQDFKKIKGGGGKITYTTFEQNSLMVHSWKTEDQVLVRYKVLFMAKDQPVLQMDFNIPFPNYDEDTREQIESSIAAVTPQTK